MKTNQKPSKAELVNFVLSLYGKVNEHACYETISELEFEIDLHWRDIVNGGNAEEINKDIAECRNWIKALYQLAESLKTPEEYGFSIN